MSHRWSHIGRLVLCALAIGWVERGQAAIPEGFPSGLNQSTTTTVSVTMLSSPQFRMLLWDTALGHAVLESENYLLVVWPEGADDLPPPPALFSDHEERPVELWFHPDIAALIRAEPFDRMGLEYR